jgi:hypothetical protein
MAGHRLYVACTAGLVVVDIKDPRQPRIVGRSPQGALNGPRQIAVQHLHAFVTDADGVKVFDLSDPVAPRPLPAATIPLTNAQGVYAARTYLYVAAGNEGLAIVDIKNPAAPTLREKFTAGGVLNDTRAVQIGSINASMFALVADGKNGLRVIQMISPENVPGHMGFSPPPAPKLIATYPTATEALAVSRGLDRDRVVDETGNQTVVFGRRGSRPFNEEEMARFLRREDQSLYRVEDVVSRNGRLETKSGHPLSPSQVPEKKPEPPVDRPRRERLERRPTGE